MPCMPRLVVAAKMVTVEMAISNSHLDWVSLPVDQLLVSKLSESSKVKHGLQVSRSRDDDLVLGLLPAS